MKKNKLHDLHDKLAQRLTQIMEAGTDDPRVLKEVREFLNDNNINYTTIAEEDIPVGDTGDIIILDEDYLAGGVANG